MISAVVLCPDITPDDRDTGEIVVQSLRWLVSAVISGVVRDVVLATPRGLDLEAIADRVGCAIVQSDGEAERLRLAASRTRSGRILVIRVGVQPDAQLVEEIDGRERAGQARDPAALRLAPQTFLQRLLPDLAPVVGILADQSLVRDASSFAALARSCRRRSRLISQARPIC